MENIKLLQSIHQPSATTSAPRGHIIPIQHSYIKSDILIVNCTILTKASQVPVDC